MEYLRVFNNPARCMQRLGFLKYLTFQASRTATSNLSALGNDLLTTVSQKVSVTPTPEIQEYIKTALTDPIYRELRSVVVHLSPDIYSDVSIRMEMQDIYLADRKIPSRRGKLIRNDWWKYPHLSVELGFLRKGTFSILARGQAFLSLVSEDEIGAFSKISTTNPLRLTTEQAIFALFCFLDKDGDVLRLLYKQLINSGEREVTDWEVGNLLPSILRQLAEEARPHVRSGDDTIKIRQLQRTAQSIEGWKDKSPKGRGARDENATIRLEPLVDLRLIAKPDPYAYRYQVNEATRILFEPLVGSTSLDDFLDNSFFTTANKCFGVNAEHNADIVAALPWIHKAYLGLRSPLGYASILEVALLAAIWSATIAGSYFEVSEVMDLLKNLQKERPELIQFNVDRWGKLAFLKISGDLPELWGHERV